MPPKVLCFWKIKNILIFYFGNKKIVYFCSGEMAEWSNAAVLKTVEGQTSGGSNPSFSAKKAQHKSVGLFLSHPRKGSFRFIGMNPKHPLSFIPDFNFVENDYVK